MSKRSAIVYLIALVGITLFMIYKMIGSIDKMETAKTVSSSLSTVLEQVNIKPDLYKEGKTIIIYFNSECDHCQNELNEINKSYTLFNQSKVILMTFEDLDLVKNYLNDLTNFKYIEYELVFIEPDKILETFGSEKLPQILIYDDLELIKKFRGETSIEAIVKHL